MPEEGAQLLLPVEDAGRPADVPADLGAVAESVVVMSSIGGAMTTGVTTLGIMALSITTLSIKTLDMTLGVMAEMQESE